MSTPPSTRPSGRHRRPPRHTPAAANALALLLALAVAAGAFWLLERGTDGPDAPVAPSPPPSAASPSAEPDPAAVIPASRPLELFIPAIGLLAGFEAGDCRVTAGNIDPATMDLACAYTAPDRPYSLPGTDSADVVVVAGHTGAGVDAVFNELYDGDADRHRVQVGDVAYLRTEASTAAGGAWLKYTATDLHEPQKELLAGDPDVWGTAATPGRLLTISCIQPPFYAPSVRNAVVGWQLAGVVGPVPGSLGPAPILPAGS